MKSLLLLVGLAGVAYADKFPASGPCDDVDACEKACKASTKGACYWGGVLTLQGPFDEEQHKRGLAMFDKACAKNDADACWQSANLVWRFESKELKTAGPKTYAAFQKACNKNHARACMRLGDIAAAAEDAKSKKLAVTVKVKGAKLLEQRCTKAKLVRACTWAASLYESGEGVKQDAKKATALRDKRCMIETGSKCPPPEPPPPPSRPMTKGMD